MELKFSMLRNSQEQQGTKGSAKYRRRYIRRTCTTRIRLWIKAQAQECQIGYLRGNIAKRKLKYSLPFNDAGTGTGTGSYRMSLINFHLGAYSSINDVYRPQRLSSSLYDILTAATMPFPTLFLRQPSSPIDIYPSRRDDHPPTPLVVTQMPSTLISIGSLVRIFFPHIHHSFSVIAEVGKIAWVQYGYVTFYLYDPVPNVDILFLAVPTYWVRLGIRDWFSYRHHLLIGERYIRESAPTFIPSSRSESALSPPTPTTPGVRSLRHAISSPFLRPPPFCGNVDMD